MADESESLDDLLAVEESLEEKHYQEQNRDPASEGWHTVVADSVKADLHNFKDGFTRARANLKMIVEDPNGPNDKKWIFDNISLPGEGESEGSVKRRTAILCKLGYISKGQTRVTFNWKKLQGTRFQVEVEHNQGEDKDGKERTYANVTFAGYRPVNGGASTSTPPTQESAPEAAGPTAETATEANAALADDGFGDI